MRLPKCRKRGNGGPAVAPVSPHVTAASASHHELASRRRHRSRLGPVCHRRRTSRSQKMRPAYRLRLVGHEMLLDDDAEGVRTFFGFER